MVHRARSAFEVDGLRKEMGGVGGWGGCLQRKREQWALSAPFHLLPTLVSHIEREPKLSGNKNTPTQKLKRAKSFLFLENSF